MQYVVPPYVSLSNEKKLSACVWLFNRKYTSRNAEYKEKPNVNHSRLNSSFRDSNVFLTDFVIEETHVVENELIALTWLD